MNVTTSVTSPMAPSAPVIPNDDPSAMRFPPHCNQLPLPNRLCTSTKQENDMISEIIRDPISDESYNLWLKIASSNTAIYKEVFGRLIPENCSKANQLKKQLLHNADKATLDELQKVRGYIVEFPQHMLCDEKSLILTILNQRLKLNVII